MQFSNQGSNPHPLQWKCGVLTAWLDKGSPERSVSNSLFRDPFKNEIKAVTSCPLRCPGHGTVLPVITWGFTGPGNLEGHCSPTWESKKHVSRVKIWPCVTRHIPFSQSGVGERNIINPLSRARLPPAVSHLKMKTAQEQMRCALRARWKEADEDPRALRED